MLVQGSGNVTSWSPGISWPTFAPTGTGKIHYDNVMTLTADQVKNASFSLNLRTDYYSAGTLKLTNFKITRVTTKAETKACGSQLGTLPTVNETGFTLNGWYTAATGGTKIATTTTMPPNNVTYYAQWTPNKYTVNYNANGGTGTMASDTATYEANYTTKANTFTRANYVFAGWNEKADGTGTNWTSWIGKPWKWNYTYGITLYAQWTAANYSVNTNPVTYTVTLAQAVAAANSAGGSTITLLRDYTDTSGVAIDRNVTLTTNGKTLTRNATITVNTSKTLTVTGTGTLQTSAAINLITNNGTLNVTHSGTLKNTNTSTGNAINNVGTATINSGTIIGAQPAVTTHNGTLYVKGGTITSTGSHAINMPENYKGTIDITGGIITGNQSGIINRGTLKISGTNTKITGQNQYGFWNVPGSNATLSSGTITSTSSRPAVSNEGTFTMNGGTLTKSNSSSSVSGTTLTNFDGANITINNGTVTSAGSAIGNGITSKGGTINITGGTVNGKENGILLQGSSRLTMTGGTVMGNSDRPVLSVQDQSSAECKNATIKSNYAADPYSIANTTGNGSNCIIRSRASNFGLTGKTGGLVIATTNTSPGQSSELVRIYSSPTHYVLFPTWTDANGQDDIQWYNTSKVSSLYNEVRIYKSNHKNESGLYNVHIYDSATSGTARNVIGSVSLNF